MRFEAAANLLRRLAISCDHRPHGSNLLTKCGGTLNTNQKRAMAAIAPAYKIFYDASAAFCAGSRSLTQLLKDADEYFDFIRGPAINCFSHQSDFTSSVLPELVCALLERVRERLGASYHHLAVRAQRDVTIECCFDIAGGGRIVRKAKRMDVGMMTQKPLVFDNIEIAFFIPVVCAEIKTNIDKNMLTGIEASVESLKRTFPRVMYYTIGEYADFDVERTSLASTHIDEVLIVRQQKRSEVRRDSAARKPLSIDVLAEFMDEVERHVRHTAADQRSLDERMRLGKLT